MNIKRVRCLIGAVIVLASVALGPSPAPAGDVDPDAHPELYAKQPCAYAKHEDHIAITWPAKRPDPRLMPLQRLFYSSAATYYLECASRRPTPPELRLSARVRAVEIYDAIGYTKGEFAVLADIAHDHSVSALSRERAKHDYFTICRLVLIGHDEDDIRTYCNEPFDSYADGAGALHDQLKKPITVAHDNSTAHAQSITRCANPNFDAAVVGNAQEPQYPEAESNAGIVGSAQIKVQLDKTGAITDASVYKSSGNANLDDAALKAAKATSFSPAISNCAAVGGSYIFRSDFINPQRPSTGKTQP